MIIHKERQNLTSMTMNLVSVIMKYLGADLCCDQALVILQGRYNPFFSTQTCWYLWLEQGVLMCQVAFKLISKINKTGFLLISNEQPVRIWLKSILSLETSNINRPQWLNLNRKWVQESVNDDCVKWLRQRCCTFKCHISDNRYRWKIVRWWRLTDWMQLKSPYLNLQYITCLCRSYQCIAIIYFNIGSGIIYSGGHTQWYTQSQQ